MEWQRCVGALLILVALFILYANLLPYWQLYTFWGRFGIFGMLIMNTFWVIKFGPMTIVGVLLLVLGVYLARKG